MIRRPRPVRWFLALVAGAFSLVATADPPAFPKQGLLPKAEIGGLRFLEAHPEHDGRGAVVAILDTGVDPGAEGLQLTSDGQPKVLDIIDATGSGDVEMSTLRKPADGKLQGLTGRWMRLPQVENPSGEFRVGFKRAWDLFPDELVGRVKKARREQWDKKHQHTLRDVRRQLDRSSAEKKSDWQAQLDVLATLSSQYDDPGPVHDCVAFHDGTIWRAIIDTDEDSDLTDEKILSDFDRERQWATFGDEDRMNFGIHVYDGGQTLSIVTDSGAHGTHVAGIVAANYPGQPERNGVAPGAQVIGIKIGDTRLDAMETGSALLRAAAAIVRHKCDLANMSYGEPTTRPSRGLVAETIAELAHKHNVLFVSSAMNSGPALSTVGAPGGTTEGVIGVGAYLSPEMMAAQYSLRENLPAGAYTFTSRGPASDGDMGVAIFAPGGAVSPVPQWTLRRSMQMNGTSMASPNACGGLALLVSALKARNIPYNPVSVRRAIQNTARTVEGVDVFSEGPGLLQVDHAFEYLQTHAPAPAERTRLAVTVSGRDQARGIYLRQAAEVRHPQTFSVTVAPKFEKDPRHESELQFELTVSLKSTQPWVDVGPGVHLAGGGRSFSVRVDPTALPPGAHFAEVQGFDTDRPERGPLFRLPVTVLRPVELKPNHKAPVADLPTSVRPARRNAPDRVEVLPSEKVPAQEGIRNSVKQSARLVPGSLVRVFVAVPPEATSASLKLTRTDFADTGEKVTVRVDAAQVPKGKHFEVRSIFAALGDEHSETFPVVGGELLELCLVRDWQSLANWSEKSPVPVAVEMTLTLNSVLPSKTELSLLPESPGNEVRLSAGLGRAALSPSASLNVRRQILKPTRAIVSLVESARDRLPEQGPLSALILDYEFDQQTAGSVTPRFPLLDDLLYDSDYGTFFWMLFDANRRRVAGNDMYPDAVSLTPGRHTLRLQIKHQDSARLDKLKEIWLALDRSFGPVSVTIAASRAAQPDGAGGFATTSLDPGESASAWIMPPSPPGGADPGDLLLGSVRWEAHGPSHVLTYAMPGTRAVTAAALPSIPLLGEKPPEIAGRLRHELLEFRLKQLRSLDIEQDRAAFDVMAASLAEEHPDQPAVPLVVLHKLDDDAERREFRLPDIVAAADAVLAKIDAKAIQFHFGANVLAEDAAGQAERRKFTELREVMIDTLYRKGRALGYMELPEVVARTPVTDPAALDKAFEANFAELRRWADVTDKKYYLLNVRRERRRENHGLALQLLLKHAADASPNKDIAEKRRDLCELLGWEHQAEHERRWLMIRFRDAFEPF